jgi:ATP-dependent helicase Lhr and Lhr-like helicase
MVGFRADISRWFTDTFAGESPIQKLAWPVIHRGESCLLTAPTGSGKTFAAFLSLIDTLARMGSRGELADTIYAVYITPLKALGNDIHRNLLQPLQELKDRDPAFPDIRVAVRSGDTPQSERARMVRRPPHILITTPESLFLVLGSKRLAPALASVRTVIVDEVHALCSDKRGVHLAVSLERLEERTGGMQRLGCSATINPLEDVALYLGGFDDTGQPRPCRIIDAGVRKRLDVKVAVPSRDMVTMNNTSLWNSAYEILQDEIAAHDTTLIFCNSRYKAERTSLHLSESGGSAAPIGVHHGSVSKELRLEMEAKLKAGDLKALVTTSSLELGIDIGSVNLVYQLESPKSVAAALQRIGRSGHLLDATSTGRILVFDRDELAEAAAISKAMVAGDVDEIAIPKGGIDVLAQQLAGAVSVEPRRVDSLLRMARRTYPYSQLSAEGFDQVVALLSGEYKFDMAYPPRPLVMWDRISNTLNPARGATHVTSMNVGTIEDPSEYEVVIDASKKRIGRIESDFVDDSLRSGDIFVLGSSHWKVLGKRKNQVLVEEAPGSTPTVPWWSGPQVSRSKEVGRRIGILRRQVAERSDRSDYVPWLQREYFVSEDAALALREYVRSQQLACGVVPDHERLLVENWRDELGRSNIIIHIPFGIRLNRTWGVALSQAAKEALSEDWSVTATNDQILLTLTAQGQRSTGTTTAETLLPLADMGNLDRLLAKSASLSGGARFRAIATCALQVLRAKEGKRIPVWLQNYRSQELFDAAQETPDYPLFQELRRLATEESLDREGCHRLLQSIQRQEIAIEYRTTDSPSPFCHSLLVQSQHRGGGAQMGRERRAHLLRLHKKQLEAILSSDEIAQILDARAIDQVEKRLLRKSEQTRVRNADELAQAIRDIGDMPADIGDVSAMVDGDATVMLEELVSRKRLLAIHVPECEDFPHRLVAAELWAQYAAAYGQTGKIPETALVPRVDGDRVALDRVAAVEYLEPRWLAPVQVGDARLAVMERYLRSRGPVSLSEIINYTGWPARRVERLLGDLESRGTATSGTFATEIATPQWINRSNLERIHRLTLRFLKRELSACAPFEVVDFMTRWQHLHPDTRLSGIDGLRTVIAQLQGLEPLQGYLEPWILRGRVDRYDPSMLDTLIASGEVRWLRVGTGALQRGRVTLCMRDDVPWLSSGTPVKYDLVGLADADLVVEIATVRDFFRTHETAFFDEVIDSTGVEEGPCMRCVWYLVWTGELTCDTYAAVRSANFTASLSACYDLGSTPAKILRGVTTSAAVIERMKKRKLDPRAGRWSATQRLTGDHPEPGCEATVRRWTRQLLDRWGIVTKELLAMECAAPPWSSLSSELKRLELLGEVSRGYFIESHHGAQYGYPEAIELLRECRGRRAEGSALGYVPDEKIFAVSGHDPANLYTKSLDMLDDRGLPIHRSMRSGNIHARLAVQSGQVLLFAGGNPANIRLLTGLNREQLRASVAALSTGPDGDSAPLAVGQWNGHPIDVSPTLTVLWHEGFRFNRKSEMVCPAADSGDAPDHSLQAQYEPYYSEEPPVEYNEDWVVSRADKAIRSALSALFAFFGEHMPEECAYSYRLPLMIMTYRQKRCAFVHIQKRQIRLHISYHGWVPGVAVNNKTNLKAGDTVAEMRESFRRAFAEIDADTTSD